MADGGEDFGDEKTAIFGKTGDQDDDEQMGDRTQPFQPGSSSTPQNGREQMEMKTSHQEHPGFPSFDETTFSGREVTVEEIERRLAALRNPRTGILDVDKVDENGILLTKEQKRSEIVKAKKYIKSQYPDAKLDQLNLDFSQKRPNQIVVIGPKGGETKVFLDDGTGFTQKFLNLSYVKKALGEPAEVIIQKLRKKQKQKRSKGGYQLIPEEEEDEKIDSMEKALYDTKTFDEVKERENEMLRKNSRENAKDLAIIQDDNASPEDKQDAQDRTNERNEEQERFQAYVAEREREWPLSERVKDIFKKYGVTVTSVLLAAGVTIGVVVSTVTNALKATGKALGKGLKDIGSKLGSLLPGLIGSVASFLFKTAGQAIGFLAEHTWLLILAVVAFLFEKNIKKRR